jgi:hypothetical protein
MLDRGWIAVAQAACLVAAYVTSYVSRMGHLSIRDLQKISGEAISTLPGATAIKSGDRTVGLLIPIRPSDPARLRAWAEKVENLAKERDRTADDAFLHEAGADVTDWSIDAVRKFKAEAKRRK